MKINWDLELINNLQYYVESAALNFDWSENSVIDFLKYLP